VCTICGTPGTPCCASRACNDGGCCYNDLCVANGANCLVSNANVAAQCHGGQCACGNVGQPCCYQGGPTTLGPCASLDLFCDASGANASGLCLPCGRKDGPCCLGITCVEAGTGCLPNSGVSQPSCKPCGGTGEPCCPSRTSSPACRSPATCNTTTGLCQG
jgi:hypothetical protein